MITPSDKGYTETKQMMLGKATMAPALQLLADWIDQTYNVRTVNILYDVTENGKLPRLEICLEREQQEASFSNKDGFSFNKPRQQAIARQFQQIVQQQGLEQKKGLLGSVLAVAGGRYRTDDVWVVYSAFEKLAKTEANESIPQPAIEAFKQQYSTDGLWEVSRFMSYTTFMVHTEQQKKALADSDTLRNWIDVYFHLLKQYDVFDYFKRETFSIVLDSKENFMNNYQGNWYYYYK